MMHGTYNVKLERHVTYMLSHIRALQNSRDVPINSKISGVQITHIKQVMYKDARLIPSKYFQMSNTTYV